MTNGNRRNRQAGLVSGCVLQTAEARRWEIEPIMATPSTPSEPASPRLSFTFYAAEGRVLVSNADQKLIDLGAPTQEHATV
jgi:hypothetical protein